MERHNTSSTGLSSRTSVNTTVNAAILAGIVESQQVGGVKHYSGGVENFPRFLENWSSTSLTYNGSMVVMFPSRYATNFWQNDRQLLQRLPPAMGVRPEFSGFRQTPAAHAAGPQAGARRVESHRVQRALAVTNQ